jgi:hypothetical protein
MCETNVTWSGVEADAGTASRAIERSKETAMAFFIGTAPAGGERIGDVLWFWGATSL